MTSEFTVPSWSLRHHRQEQVQGEDLNISSLVNHHNHHQHHGCGQSSSQLVPMSNYEVAELTWENGQLLMHELGGIFSSKPTWGRAGDTLESIVHQATYKYIDHDDNNNNDQNLVPQGGHTLENVGPIVGSSDGKWVENTGHAQSGISRRRVRHGFDHFGKDLSHDWQNEAGVSASAGAILPRKNDTTAVTLASFESSQRSKKSKTTDEDSTSHGAPENREKEERETRRSCSTRKGRAAAIHNQSERRRRDRINQKMKALQKLVPNASKTDKASMLDEVIEYLKQLQAQVQMMSSSARFMPHMMMMPTGMHHHQMSVLRMGMAAGMAMNMGMLDSTGIPATLTPPFQPVKAANSTSTHVPPPSLVAPTRGPQQKSTESCISSANSHDPYSTFLAQSMKMDLCKQMAMLYSQQMKQTTNTAQGGSDHSL